MLKFTNFNSCKNRFFLNRNLLAIALSSIMIFISLKFLFSNIALLLFVLFIIIDKKKLEFKFNLSLLVPILFYLTMILSLLWTTNINQTISGLTKELPFFILPLSFMLCSTLNYKLKQTFLRIYSLGMVIYAFFCFLYAAFRFSQTSNKNVFIFHELVSLDVNAIYISFFASFCLFYFIQLKSKKTIDLISIYVLTFFVLSLASKTIILIDVCMLIWFYIKYASINKSVRLVTLLMVGTFVIVSVIYVDQLQKRVLDEYETAFVDNSVNDVFGSKENKVYNVSLKQAWLKKEFTSSDFIPGTALRVFHIRIFKEMFFEHISFFYGFGQDASTESIKKKYEEYKIFSNFNYFNFHNQFIQTFSELGFLGLFLLILMVVINFKNAYVNNDFMHTFFAFSIFIVFITESILIRQRGILFFIILYCIFNTQYKKLTKS